MIRLKIFNDKGNVLCYTIQYRVMTFKRRYVL